LLERRGLPGRALPVQPDAPNPYRRLVAEARGLKERSGRSQESARPIDVPIAKEQKMSDLRTISRRERPCAQVAFP